MAIAQMERTDGPDAQIGIFVESCWSVWAHAQWIVVYRHGKGKPVQIARSGVVLVHDPDGKLVNDVAQTVEPFVRIAKADAERLGGCDYKFELWGPRELGDKRRKVIAPAEELHGQRIRFGDAEDTTSVDGSMLREGAGLLRANASATHDITLSANNIADQYAKLIGIQTSMLTAQAAAMQASDERDAKHAGIHLEVKKLEFDFKVKEHEWHREDEAVRRINDAAAEERKHELTIREKRNEMLGKMADKAMENGEVMGSISYVIRSVGDLMQAGATLLRKGQQAAGFDGAAGTDASGSASGTLGPRLVKLIGGVDAQGNSVQGVLNAAGMVELEKALGQDVYDLVKAASRKHDDDEVRAVLAPIQERWNPIDRIVNDPETGKLDASKSKVYSKADKERAWSVQDQALRGVAEILTHRFMPEFTGILTDAGIVLKYKT